MACGNCVVSTAIKGRFCSEKHILELAFCFRLNIVDHLLVAEKFHVLGDIEALIDSKLKPLHTSSLGSLSELDLNIDATRIQLKDQFFSESALIIHEMGWPKTLAPRGLNSK